jgi:hypothetical protein
MQTVQSSETVKQTFDRRHDCGPVVHRVGAASHRGMGKSRKWFDGKIRRERRRSEGVYIEREERRPSACRPSKLLFPSVCEDDR